MCVAPNNGSKDAQRDRITIEKEFLSNGYLDPLEGPHLPSMTDKSCPYEENNSI